MSGENSLLRWKEHSLFPYTCVGCGTKHPKGDGIYLDQTGPRTKTFDTPQCREASPASRLASPGGPSSPMFVSHAPPSTRAPPEVAGGVRAGPHLSITLELAEGKSVEVRLAGHGVDRGALEHLAHKISDSLMELEG